MSNVTHIDSARGGAPAAQPAVISIENEQSFLGALMLNNEILFGAGAALEMEHFSEEIHQRIFDVARSLIQGGKVASPVTMRPFLGDQDLGGGMTMPAYLARLCATCDPPLTAATHANVLIDLFSRKRLIEIADAARGIALDPPASATVSELIDKVEEDLAALRTRSPTKTVTRGLAGDFAEKLFEQAELKRLSPSKEAEGMTTGIPDLDRDTGGFGAGLLWVVAGRPGMGKTVIGANLARAAAAHGGGVLFFSLEVPQGQITARFVADLAFLPRKPLSFGDIEHGNYDDEEAERIVLAGRRLKTMPLVIDCASRLTVSQIGSRVRAERLRMEKLGTKLRLIVVDYVKFVSATDRYAGQRHYEVGEISAGLKQLAKDQDVCVVLLAQLNRAVENRDDKRPGLADLRESGDLEADADVVAFVYREVYYIEKSAEFRRHEPDAILRADEARNNLELIIGKNRAGPTRSYPLWANVACSTTSARVREDF